jgi:succinate dehydrogenase / fumarate reductase cytochrome b subunit
MHWLFAQRRPSVAVVVVTQQQPRSVVGRTWGTTVGRKAVMAVTGLIFLLFVVAHMLGNLKVFFGVTAFDAYSEHLRTLGAEIIGHSSVLWIVRIVLLGSVVLHGAAAASLWWRARKARPVRYRHRSSASGTYAARTMRWGGVIIGLFVIWHILDLTTGTVNPAPAGAGAYEKLVASFDRPVVAVFYLLAVLALGLHIGHGLWSAVQTLGGSSAMRQHALRTFSVAVAVAITAGFAVIPISVMTGLVR